MRNFISYSTVWLISFTALTVVVKVPAKSSKCRLLQKEMHDPSDFLGAKGCVLKQYNIADVVQCIDRMAARKDLNNKHEWHIAFMGDSRIRQMYQSFARLLPREDLEIKGHSHPRDRFGQQNALITSELLSVRITFYWQAYPDHLAPQFRVWLNNHDRAPDHLILGQTLWSMLERDHSFSNFTKAYKEMAPLIRKLTKYTDVIWWDQDPVNEKQYHLRALKGVKADVNNARIKEYDGSVRRLLRNTGATFWDSTGVLLNEYVRSCDIMPNRRDSWGHWKCNDYIHTSFLYCSIYNQQLLNYLCNPLLNLGPKYCCNET